METSLQATRGAHAPTDVDGVEGELLDPGFAAIASELAGRQAATLTRDATPASTASAVRFISAEPLVGRLVRSRLNRIEKGSVRFAPRVRTVLIRSTGPRARLSRARHSRNTHDVTDKRVPKEKGAATTPYQCTSCGHEWDALKPDRKCPNCGSRQVKAMRLGR